MKTNGKVEMAIQLATVHDAAEIAKLHAASWRMAYSNVLSEQYLNGDILGERTAHWSRLLASPKMGQRVVLAKTDGILIGFACAYLDSDPIWGSSLDNLHVLQAHQSQGIGTRLMGEVAKICVAEAKQANLYLWVLEPNDKARRFYERLGAANLGQDVWLTPDGGAVPKLRYAWQKVDALLN